MTYHAGYPRQRENRENGKKIPCQGKHIEFGNFAKTQGKHREFGLIKLLIVILEVKNIWVFAAKISIFSDDPGKAVLCM